MVYKISKYGHLPLGLPSPHYINGRVLLEAVNKVKPLLNSNLIKRGREIVDLILPYERSGLPTIMVGDNCLKKLEEAANPYSVIPIKDLRDFILDFGSKSPSEPNMTNFLNKYDLTMKQGFGKANPRSGKLMILSGPSGVGKGTLQDHLLAEGLPKFVLDNIRNRRPYEWNGYTYYFIPGSDILIRCQSLVDMKDKGLFIATALVHEEALVNKDDGSLKIPGARSQGVRKNLLSLVENGNDLFVEVDIKLASQIIAKARQKDIKINYAFLLPSSFDELITRIIGRTLKEEGSLDKLLSKEIIKKINERLENGIGEMAFSFLLYPSYVVNAENRIKESVDKLRTALSFNPSVSSAVGLKTKDKISGQVTVNEYDKAIKKAEEEGLELLPSNYPIIDKVPTEVIDILKDKIVKLTANGTIKTGVPAILDVMRDKELMALVWRSCGFPNLLELTGSLHPGVPQKYTLAIQPGTLAPYHVGHISFAQGAILDGGLAETVVLSGSDPPEKKFVIAAHHRENMVRLGLIDKPYLHYSNIRVQMMEALGSVVLGGAENKHLIDNINQINESGSAEEKQKLRKALDQERRLRDLAAFSFLISMNPHLKWEYIVGVDKVNGYGISGKNEKDLIMDLLIANNIPIRYYTRAGEEFKLFENEEKYVSANQGAKSWVLENKEKIDNLLYEGATPSFDISATQVREMIENNEPLLDVLPPPIINYIYGHNLISAYALENKAKMLAKQLKGNKIKEEEAKLVLQEINNERSALFAVGILANGDPLTLDDIRNL